MPAVRGIAARVLAGLLPWCAGCTLFSSSELGALREQNRSLSERSRSCAEQAETLRLHARHVEDQLRRAEEQLARLDEKSRLDAQQLARYRREEAELRQQVAGLLRSRGPTPPPGGQPPGQAAPPASEGPGAELPAMGQRETTPRVY